MAILAEKYAVDYTWYVDVILNLIRIAGDYVSEEVSMFSADILMLCTLNFWFMNEAQSPFRRFRVVLHIS